MTTAVLESAIRSTSPKGSSKSRRPKSRRRNQRSSDLGLKSSFVISAIELDDGSVKVFFGEVGLVVTPDNEVAIEEFLEGTMAGKRIDAMFDALPESVRIAALSL